MSGLVSVPVITECKCGRPHRSHLEFASCAWPTVKWTAKVNGEFAVLVRRDDETIGTLYRSLREAARRCATLEGLVTMHDEDPRTPQLWAILP